MLKRAQDENLVKIDLVDIRDFATDRHRTVDDRPYGGGPGMLLKPEPLLAAVESRRKKSSKVVYLSPQGVALNSTLCKAFSKEEHIILLCGHYEGIDQRVIDLVVDSEVSIGDYILTSGCPASVVFVDAVVRMIPGVLSNPQGTTSESFEDGLLEEPQYTRPRTFKDKSVPEVLLNGNHKEVATWRCKKRVQRTQQRRPELLESKNKEINCVKRNDRV